MGLREARVASLWVQVVLLSAGNLDILHRVFEQMQCKRVKNGCLPEQIHRLRLSGHREGTLRLPE